MKKLQRYKLCGNVQGSVSSKLLYLILNDLVGKSGEITITQRKISEALNISKGTVSRNLRKLKDGGYIEVRPQYHPDGGRTANKYVVK